MTKLDPKSVVESFLTNSINILYHPRILSIFYFKISQSTAVVLHYIIAIFLSQILDELHHWTKICGINYHPDRVTEYKFLNAKINK